MKSTKAPTPHLKPVVVFNYHVCSYVLASVKNIAVAADIIQF